MARIKYGYFADSSYAESMPRVAKALVDSTSDLSKMRSNYAKLLRKANRSKNISTSTQDVYEAADLIIFTAGDKPQAAAAALTSALNELRQGIEVSKVDFAAKEVQTVGGVLAMSEYEDQLEEARRLGELEAARVPNEQIYAAYKSIFGVMP